MQKLMRGVWGEAKTHIRKTGRGVKYRTQVKLSKAGQGGAGQGRGGGAFCG